MSTTAIFIELLITGLQTIIWISLIILCFVGVDWINPERLKGYEAIIAVILLPIVYPIGVIFDRVANDLYNNWEGNIQRKYISDEAQSTLTLLMTTKDASLAAYLNYNRSRVRITRSSAVNFGLITLTSVIFTIFRCRKIQGFPVLRVVILELLIGLSLTILAALTWNRITHSYYKLVSKGYNSNVIITGGGEIDSEISPLPPER